MALPLYQLSRPPQFVDVLIQFVVAKDVAHGDHRDLGSGFKALLMFDEGEL